MYGCLLLLPLMFRDFGGASGQLTEASSPSQGNMTVWTSVPPSQCGNGHLQGYVGMCPGSGACLTKLQATAKTAWRSELKVDKARTVLLYVPGSSDAAHLIFLTFLTDLQWRAGVFGCVGELGTGENKFTAMLSFNTDMDAGERLVLADDFTRMTVSNPTLAKLESLHMFLGPLGVTTSGDRRVYLQQGGSAGIDRATLNGWGLSQFRVVSISGNQDAATLLTCLEKAACILRDGGIVIVDGVDVASSPARTALGHFLVAHTRSVFTPLLLVRKKLYLCTTNWRQRFAQQIVLSMELVVAYDIHERTDSVFGPELTYFSVDR